MNENDKLLEDYIHKMYQLQNNSNTKALNEQELKQIALDTGMSENEWLETQKIFEDHIKKGNGHSMYKNWYQAHKEYQQASVINPYSIDAIYGLANASFELWKDTEEQKYKKEAKELLYRCQQISPGHRPSLSLMSSINKNTRANKTAGRKKLYAIGATAIVILLALIISYISISNKIVERKSEVDEAWAQVENVYMRRSSLIPDLVEVVKSATEFERSVINSLVEAQSDMDEVFINRINKENMQEFQKKQKALTVAFNEFVAYSRNRHPELKSMEIYRDLMAQIEGTENRIAVERRRFNMTVESYNRYVNKFPASLLGKDEMPYFKVDESAMEKPEIEL